MVVTGKFRHLCLGLIAALAIGGASEALAGKGNTLIAFDVFELNLDIDTTLDIGGGYPASFDFATSPRFDLRGRRHSMTN